MVPPNHPTSREDDDERPLTGDDIADLRKMIAHADTIVAMAVARKRWSWLRQWARRYALGTVGLAAILAALKDDLSSLAAWLFSRGNP